MILTASMEAAEKMFKKRLFNHEPGFDNPQYGHTGSSELMSFRQLGQSIEFFSLADILTL
jgi:hypothetical protein